MKKLLKKQEKEQNSSIAEPVVDPAPVIVPASDNKPDVNDRDEDDILNENKPSLDAKTEDINDDSIMPILNQYDNLNDKSNDLEMNITGPAVDQDFEMTKRETVPSTRLVPPVQPNSNRSNNIFQPPMSREQIIAKADIKPVSYFKPPKI